MANCRYYRLRQKQQSIRGTIGTVGWFAFSCMNLFPEVDVGVFPLSSEKVQYFGSKNSSNLSH